MALAAPGETAGGGRQLGELLVIGLVRAANHGGHKKNRCWQQLQGTAENRTGTWSRGSWGQSTEEHTAKVLCRVAPLLAILPTSAG